MRQTFTLKVTLLAFLATFFFVASSFGQSTITTGTIDPAAVCAGSSVSVPFTTTGTVAPLTSFVAQLSDASGAFGSPVEIGTSATSPITANIPAATAAGAGYKVRVVSILAVLPVATGSESALTVNAIPAAPGVTTPVSFEQGKPATALTATGAGLLWYNAATGGTGSATAPVPSTNAAGTTSYYVSQTVTGCESPRAKIDVTVTACTPPAKPTVADVNYTIGDAATPLSATPTDGLLWYTAATGGTGSATAPTPSTTTAGTTSYFVSRTAGGCESERSEIKVTVSACATPAPGVSNKTYNVGETATALTATGTALKWYTAATGGTGSATAPTPTTTAPGEQRFYVSQTVGGCEGPRAEIVVTVNCATPKPTVENKTYTVGQDAPVLTATGTALKWYTSETGGTGSATAPKPSTAAAGTTTYYVTQTLNNCESERAAIVVTVSACATPAPTVSNVNYNVGATATAVSAQGTALKWYAAATGGSALAGAPTPTTTSPGEQRFYVSQTLNNCEGPRAEIIVTVTCATPKPGVANLNYTVGQNAPVLTATGTALKWYANETGGTPLASAPKPSTTTPGTTTYYVSQTLNNCESERAAITVTVGACATPAPGVANVTYKAGDAATALTATGTALKWYTAATGGTGSATAPTPTTTAPGEQRFYVSQTLNNCEGPRAEIIVTVTCATPKPGVANVTYTIGQNAPVLTATGTALKWYTAETGGSPLASAPKPATTTVGTTTYYVSQTLNSCESERAAITVTISCNTVTLPVVTNVQICQNAEVTPLKASPIAGHIWVWYTSATGGTGSTTAPEPPTTEARSYSYFVSQRNTTTNCESNRVELTVNVREAARPTVVTPVQYCVGETASALSPAGSTFKWYTALTGGTGTTTAPKPVTTTPGTTSYYVTQSTSYGSLVCESTRAKLDVIVNATPANLTTLSEAFCQERTDKTYTFPTEAGQGNTLRWYTAATGGTGSATTPSIDLKTAATTTYYVTQVFQASQTKSCESPTRVAQTVRVKPLPAQPTLPQASLEYCQFIVADPLKATPVANATLNWFGTDATGGTPSAEATVPSTETGGTTSYYVAQTLEGCVSDRAKIDVKVNTTPKPTTDTSLEFCQGEAAKPLTAEGSALKWYREANGTTSQTNPFTPFTERVQDYSFYVTQTGSNGCESPKEEIKIHIKSLPSATISGNTSIDLGSSASITIRFTGDGPWIYALSDGKTDTTDQATTQVVVTPNTTTTYLVTQVSNACGKGIPIGSAIVTVRVPTIKSGNPSVAEACAGKSFSVPFQQSGDFPTGNTFKVQISTSNVDTTFVTIPSVASGNSVTATFPLTTAAGSYFVRVISSGANDSFLVKGSVSAISITASPIPVATLSGAQTILAGESAQLKMEATGKAPWTFTLNNGTKDSLITASVTPFAFMVKPAATTTYTITRVTNGCGIGTGVGSARVQVDPILGVEPANPGNWVKVYPTAVQSVCTVEISGSIKPQAKVEVIDMNGRARATHGVDQKTTMVDFSKYPSGLYLIRIQNGNQSAVQRVLKP